MPRDGGQSGAVGPVGSAAVLPPSDPDAEMAILGAMLISDAAIGIVLLTLVESDYSRAAHRVIHRAIGQLSQSGEGIDEVTVSDQLERMDALESAGGRAFIHGLADVTPIAVHLEQYVSIVKELALIRQLINASAEVAQSAYARDGSGEDLLDRAQDRFFQIAQRGRSDELVLIGDKIGEVFAELHGDVGATGVRTGLRDLDDVTFGFQPGSLVILAARPSMGKTSLALNMAAAVGLGTANGTKSPVAIFSLEMSFQDLMKRILFAEAKVDSEAQRHGRLQANDWQRLNEAAAAISQAPIFIDETSSPTVMEIRTKCRRLKQKHADLGLIVIDYLQLIQSSERVENRVQEISAISRQLKLLARDLDVPVLALSQLSRAVEQRTDKHPTLSDLRESGSIEQDADVVIFIYREEYYLQKEAREEQEAGRGGPPPATERLQKSRGTAELMVAKNRNGRTANVEVAYLARYTRFGDLAGSRDR